MMIPAQPYLLDVKDAAVVMQSQLAKLGINVNLKIIEQGVLLPAAAPAQSRRRALVT